MSWNGVKKYTNNAEIKTWCEEMGIKRYTINDKGEIDVDGYVDLSRRDLKELPYKFGKITGPEGVFTMYKCKNLISLKNCPDEVSRYFDIDCCSKLDSLEGCPKKVERNFYCRKCKREFTKEEIKSLCFLRTNKLFL